MVSFRAWSAVAAQLTNSATRRALPLRESLWTLDLSFDLSFEASFDDMLAATWSVLVETMVFC